MQSQMRTHLTIVAWLNILLGLPLLGIGLFLAVIGVPLLVFPPAGILVLVFALAALLNTVAGFALLGYQEWARVTLIICSIIGLFNASTFGLSTAVAIYTLIILFHPTTAELFERRGY